MLPKYLKMKKSMRKNKSAFEWGFGTVIKIAITLIIGGLFLWLTIRMIRAV